MLRAHRDGLMKRQPAISGRLPAGALTNIIPELCVVEAEARSRDEGKLEKLVGEIVAAFENAAGTFPSGTLEIEK